MDLSQAPDSLLTDGHLSEDSLHGLVEGFLTRVEDQLARQHLSRCENCRDVFAVLTQSANAEIPGVAAGSNIGRFRLLNEVGSGSIGRVWAAWDPVLSRRVAVKVLRRRSSSTAQTLLLREAQALARLTHPHVVAVHDAGFEGNFAWLAMEFVEGTTLPQWLRAQSRTSREVVQRYREACAGLAAAHRVGLLHRDFKPSNLMIGEDGRLRVTDFGLASLADEAVGASVLTEPQALTASLTDTGALVGTPAYLAPEIWEGSAATVATDQFSVGVALFESLTGRRPFEGATTVARLRAIATGPSWPPGLGGISNRLKAVVARTLSIDPARRFPSIEELERELGAIERRSVWWGAAALVSIAAAGFAAFAGIAFERRRSRCNDLAQQWSGVWDARTKARLLADQPAIFTPLERQVDDWVSRWVAAREDACRAELETRIPQRGQASCLEEQRRLLEAVLADLKTGTSTPAQSAEAIAALTPPKVCVRTPHPEQAREEGLSGSGLASAQSAFLLGMLDDAQARAEQTIGQAREAGRKRTEAAGTLLIGQILEIRGRAEDAEKAIRAAIALGELAGANDLVSEAWSVLVRVVGLGLRQRDRAEQLLEIAEAIVSSRGTPAARAELAATRANLTLFAGRLPEAEEQAKIAREAIEQAYGDWRVGWAERVLGNTYHQERRFEEALQTYRAAETRMLAALPPHHSSLLGIQQNIGLVLTELRRFDDAESVTRRVLEARLTHFPVHPDIAGLYLNLGRIYKATGRLQEARQAYEESLRLKEASFGKDHLETAMALNNLAGVFNAQRNFRAELELDERAYRIRIKALGPDHLDVVMSLVNLGHAHQGLGNCAAAIEYFGKALVTEEKKLGPEADSLAEELTGIGECLLELGRPAKARPVLERAIRLREKTPGPADELAASRLALGRALAGLGEVNAGRELVAKAAPDLDKAKQKQLNDFWARYGK